MDTQPFLSTTEEQQAYNGQECPQCKQPRWLHLNAILCTEHTTSLDDVLVAVNELRADIAAVKSFVDQLEAAVKSHPMAKALFG